MAKLTVEYHCGHEVDEVRFGGKYTEQLEYAKDHLDCPECYRARKIVEREQQTVSQLAGLTGITPVELQGSEKQVKWATDLRAKVLSEVYSMIEKVKPEQREPVRTVVGLLASEPSAKWWIDQRDLSPLKLAADYAKVQGLI